jgi:hypothetical protein
MVLRGFVHIHSNIQAGQLSISELADLHRRRGYDFICITDHVDELTAELYLESSALCRSLSDDRFLCLYGVEGATRSGPHLMAIAPGEFVPLAELGFQAAVEAVHHSGGVAVLVHPTRDEVSQIEGTPLDGIEVWNGTRDGWGPNCDLLRILLAKQETGRAMVAFGGPDAHTVYQHFKVETILDADKLDAESVLDCLKTGRFFLRRGLIRIPAVGSRPTAMYRTISLLHSVYVSSLRLGKALWTPLGVPIPESLRRLLERSK